MFGLGETRLRVYVCKGATDMRMSFRGLSGKVRHVLEKDPLSGHLFCFINKRRSYMKVLYWSNGGYCIWSKQLTRGTFNVGSGKELTVQELQQMIDGIDLEQVKKRQRFRLAA